MWSESVCLRVFLSFLSFYYFFVDLLVIILEFFATVKESKVLSISVC